MTKGSLWSFTTCTTVYSFNKYKTCLVLGTLLGTGCLLMNKTDKKKKNPPKVKQTTTKNTTVLVHRVYILGHRKEAEKDDR